MTQPRNPEYHWTPAQQRAFIECYAETGTASAACLAVGKSRRSAYALRQRADGLAFRMGWDGAALIARTQVADLLMERALEGQWIETIRYPEENRTARRIYDNRLSMGLLTRLDTRCDSLPRGSAEAARALIVSQDFEAFMELVEGGAGMAETEAFMARWSLAPDGMIEAVIPKRQLSEAEEIENMLASLEGWHHPRLGYLTNFPPPKGFAGEEFGDYAHSDYERSMTPEEERAFRARPADPAEDSAGATLARFLLAAEDRRIAWFRLNKGDSSVNLGTAAKPAHALHSILALSKAQIQCELADGAALIGADGPIKLT
jgi:hypothetical protein